MVEIARTYFFPAFALRQNRVENFQLLRSDTGRNASYVNSLRRLIYRCYTVVDKQLVIRVHVDCMEFSWALCMTWSHDKDRRTHAERLAKDTSFADVDWLVLWLMLYVVIYSCDSLYM